MTKGRKSKAAPEDIIKFLTKNGPTTLPDIAKHFNLTSTAISKQHKKEPDRIEQLSLSFGSGGNPSTRPSRLFNIDMNSPKVLLTIRDDPRVVDFYINLIKVPIRTPGGAKAVSSRLRRLLGEERTTKIMDKVYTYSGVMLSRRDTNFPMGPKWVSTCGRYRKVKFSNDEFLHLYLQGKNDAEIGELLGVTPKAIRARRIGLGLDPIKLRLTKLHLLRLRIRVLD